MASAIEKFVEAMNKTSINWTKSAEIICRDGQIFSVKSEGFMWRSDEQKKENDSIGIIKHGAISYPPGIKIP